MLAVGWLVRAKTETSGVLSMAADSPELIYQLKITLRDSKPPVWRRVSVDAILGQSAV
jgi:hypothetical protein